MRSELLHTQWQRSRRDRRTRQLATATLLAICLPVLLQGVIGCRATQPDSATAPDAISLDLDVIPLMVPADTARSATVWVTVLQGGNPVSDSTVVNLVTNLGTIPPQAYTRDGLATTDYTPALEPGVAMIVAQARGVRDTMHITLY
jgi:hypothetical protein